MTQVSLSPQALEQLCSRICHDLISPVGAINNGAELMQELGMDAGEEAVELIADSAAGAAHKLKMFRFAYGAAGSAPTLDPREVHAAASEYFKGTRTKFTWDMGTLQGFMDIDDRPAGHLKMVILATMQADEALRKDGEVIVTLDGNTAHVTATGTPLTFHDGVSEAFAGKLRSKDITPRNINAYIMNKIAQHFELQFTHEYTADASCRFSIAF